MIVQRYINKKLLGNFASSLAVLLIFALVSDFIKNIDRLMVLLNRGEADTVLQYILLKSILFLYLISPPASSLATALCFAGLWRSNEIVPMITAGLNKLRLVKNVIALSLLCGLLLFAIDEFCFPYILPRLLDIESNVQKSSVDFGVVSIDRSGSRLDARRFDKVSGQLEDVEVILINSKLQKERKIVAREARWDSESLSWILYSGLIEHYENGLRQVVTTADNKVMFVTSRIGEDGYLLGRDMFEPKTFYKSQLTFLMGLTLEQTLKMVSSYPELAIYKIRLVLKILNVALVLVLVLPITGMVLREQVKSFALATGIAFIFILIFFVAHFAVLIQIGIAGLLNPYIAACITPAGYLSYGIYLLRK